MPKDNRIRSALYVRTIDGDTFVAQLLVAPGVAPRPDLVTSIRVHNWPAPELNQPEGIYMRDEFERFLKAAKTIDVQLRGMSFQRIVCSVWLDDVLFTGLLERRLAAFRTKVAAEANK